uniref:Predicted gene 11541 n=1 Tax=Cricetulus griseus TaxID=10029 RepID=A0A8C2N2D6_CRIGR
MKTSGRCSLVDSFEEVSYTGKNIHVGKKECLRLNPPHCILFVCFLKQDEGYKKQPDLYFTLQTLQMQFVVSLTMVRDDTSCSCLDLSLLKYM